MKKLLGSTEIEVVLAVPAVLWLVVAGIAYLAAAAKEAVSCTHVASWSVLT